MAEGQNDDTNPREIYLQNLLDRILDERIEAAMFGPLPKKEMRAAVETVQSDLIKKLLALTLSGAEGKEIQSYARSFVLLSDWLGDETPANAAAAARVSKEDIDRLEKVLRKARHGA